MIKKNFLWTFYGQISRIIFQSSFILVLAVLLKPEQYGKYVIVSAIIVILGPFCGLGIIQYCIELIIRKKMEVYKVKKIGFKIIAVSFTLLMFLGVLVIYFVFDFDSKLIILFLVLGFSDLFLLKMTELNSQIQLATDKFNNAAHIQFMISFSRFLSVIFAYLISLKSTMDILDIWLYLYISFSLLSFFLSLLIVKFEFYKFYKEKQKVEKDHIKDGVYYSIGLSSQGIYNDIDKVILGKFSGTYSTGIYGFSYKILDVIFVPLKALLTVSFPKFMKIGRENPQKLNKLLLKQISISYGYLLFISFSVYLIVPYIINYFFKEKYGESIPIIYYLFPILFLRITNYLVADYITGTGNQKIRSYIQMFVAALNIIVSIMLIKKYGINGAILASYISEIVMFALLFIVKIVVRRHKEINNEKNSKE